MTRKLKIGIAGTGYIAHYHARALQKQKNIEIYSVCSRTMQGAMDFAKLYDILNYSDSFDTLLHDPQIDAILILTPNALHKPYAIQALDAGKHVFVEKPAALTAKEADAIRKRAQLNKLNVMIGHMWRFDEETKELRKVVQSGILGEIVKTKGYGIHKNWGPTGWFCDRKLAGGGALIDMGVHAIDTVRFLLGDPEPLEVYAQLDTKYGDYQVDDSGIIFIYWSNGTRSIIESGWWHPYSDGPEASTQLYGTKGYGRLFPTEYLLAGQNKVILPKVEKTEHCDQRIYDQQMRQFVSDIGEKRISQPGIDEGLCIMKIIDAAYLSSSSGQAVSVPS